MSRAMFDLPAIAILAKAPVSGYAKTRLIPALGADGAAALQARMIERTVKAATSVGLGPTALWAAPDESHPLFRSMNARFGIALHRQPDGDLGARLHAAIAHSRRPTLAIGTDCPALDADHLHRASATLRNYDAVVIPAEDGGYVLIGMREPQPSLFEGMQWSTDRVMDETRQRLRDLNLRWRELPTLWDVDRPEDVERMKRENLI